MSLKRSVANVKDMQQQRTVTPPLATHARAHPILQLQQSIGNQAVQRLLRSGTIQARLNISQPGDPFEQEADRVVEKVMRMPAPAVQRSCASCADGGSPCPECEAENEKTVQRKVRQSRDSVDESVPEHFLQDLGSGRPLAASTRAFFEPRFGVDFSLLAMSGCTPAKQPIEPRLGLTRRPSPMDVIFGWAQERVIRRAT